MEMKMNKRTFLKSIGTLILFPKLVTKVVTKPLKISKSVSLKFQSFIFPAIKNVWPQISTTDFINIQPMSGPSAKIFYMDFVYTERHWWQFWKRKKPSIAETDSSPLAPPMDYIPENGYPSFTDIKD